MPDQFRIHFSQQQLDDLRRRLDSTRLPPPLGDGWQLGTSENYMPMLLRYWADTYDWKKKEAELNEYPQFTADIDGQTVHYFHVRSSRPDAPALLLAHGWPDSFLRYVKTFPLLADYNLVVPSLPGFAFSSLPARGFSNNAEAAALWHRLMTEVLNCPVYAASGGDMGRGVVCYLAANHPEAVRGIHLTDVGLVRELIGAPDDTLTPAELDYKQRAQAWMQMEGAYIGLQGTKPQSAAYALSDSPAGIAGWLTEKYHAWSDWPCITMDDLCDCLTLYWMTNTAATSIRAYHGNSFTLPPMGRIEVPTAVAVFPQDVLPAPRSWVEAHYPVVVYERMPRGGHFTALEAPDDFAASIVQFMNRIF